nr:MAG TPA: hypothetical protein [Crassvirales sp.]
MRLHIIFRQSFTDEDIIKLSPLLGILVQRLHTDLSILLLHLYPCLLKGW